LKAFLAISNKDEDGPHEKCVNMTHPEDTWQCLMGRHIFDHLESKLLILQPQYDTNAITRRLGIGCLTEGESKKTLKECSPAEIIMMDALRMALITQAFKKAVKEGQSVWSNACAWHTALPQNDVYYSDKQRASVDGAMLTAQQAVEKFIFDRETIV
jgi:hypothetical protein